MLIFDKKLNGLAVASIQASHRIGLVISYLIDPRKLHIISLDVDSRLNPDPLVLYTSDIKEFTPFGLVIDHDDQLMEKEGLVRLEEISAINFKLIGKEVKTEDGHKLGKVNSFVFDTTTWLIMKLYVSQSLIKNAGTNELIIARSQIVKVTDSNVIVRSGSIKKKQKTFGLKRVLFGSPKAALSPDSFKSEV